MLYRNYLNLGGTMERIINLHVEKLPEGYYLATSDDIQGLVVQGRTVAETMEIARDVARRLLEAQKGRKGSLKLSQVKKSFDLQLVVSN
jgi:predicted RNase H-like HicB family nuclease